MGAGLYNLIMHARPEFWSGGVGYVDFPKDRFLEHTEADLKDQFSPLDRTAINKLKRMPTLFAIEHEDADTRIGKITDIEVKPRHLRVHFEFDEQYTPLTKGALDAAQSSLDIDQIEFYRTHWAIKKADIAEFYEKRSKGIEGVFDKIKKDLDTPNPEHPNHTKITVLYACNGSGKTRLSKLFADQYDEQVLYYNAFTEDLFGWDNENCVLEIDNKAWIFRFIQEQGLDRQIIDTFQRFTGSRLEPFFNIEESKITFSMHGGDREHPENIKISRGEESIFIWSVFYTILDVAVEALNASEESRTTTDFDNIQYVVIDDPVSSMDDTRIITVALELAKLISNSKKQLKFLITTHHALFFNVLFNVRKKSWDRKYYVLSKDETEFFLKPQGNDSPFAYHHAAMAEIAEAIKNNDIRKYHFNIFRALLEKTANFIGYDHWKKCLEGSEHNEPFAKIIDHYSHNRLSELEYKDLTNGEVSEFKAAFHFFVEKFKWGTQAND